ncbi:MAG: DUF4131 domain-containing protein, partial [Candidatus Saccharicenans sp.]
MSLILNPGYKSGLIIILIAFLLAAWAGYLLKRDRLALVLILTTFFLAGFCLYSFLRAEYYRNPLRQLPAEDYLDFKGKLIRSPERRPDRDLLVIKVKEVEIAGEKRKIEGNLRLSVPHSTTGQTLELLAGDQIEFSATLTSEESFRNFFPDFMP